MKFGFLNLARSANGFSVNAYTSNIFCIAWVQEKTHRVTTMGLFNTKLIFN